MPLKRSIDWDKIDGGSYLRGIEAIKKLDYLSFNNKITIFVGENGSGKTTMLEAIAVGYGFNPEGGTKNYSFSTYDSHSELCDAIKLSRGIRKPKWGYFLRAEILSFDDGQIHPIDYEDTDSYQKRADLAGTCFALLNPSLSACHAFFNASIIISS